MIYISFPKLLDIFADMRVKPILKTSQFSSLNIHFQISYHFSKINKTSTYLTWFAAYRIRVIAAPLLNWAPGNVKSLVFGVFLEYTPTFCLKSPLFGGFFELTPTQKPILKNRTPGLQWRGYGIKVINNCCYCLILLLHSLKF